MTVTAADVDAFARDGAICLRAAFPPEWVERLAGFASFL